MRKTVLLLASMAAALVLASGVALAVTKHCGKSKCVGTKESDRLLGNDAPNWMLGRGGNDTLKGFGESDGLSGGLGRDTLYGSDGPDNISGGRENDKLFGGTAEDSFDTLTGGPGNDRLNGGPSVDYYEFYRNAPAGGFGRDLITEVGDKRDSVSLFVPADFTIDLTSDAKPNVRNQQRTMTVDWEGTVIEDAYSYGGNATMIGNDGPNDLEAWAGENSNNNISGEGSSDYLKGDEGDDTISGGEGDDFISGGGGSDTVDCGDGNDHLQIQDGSPEPLNCETVVWF